MAVFWLFLVLVNSYFQFQLWGKKDSTSFVWLWYFFCNLTPTYFSNLLKIYLFYNWVVFQCATHIARVRKFFIYYYTSLTSFLHAKNPVEGANLLKNSLLDSTLVFCYPNCSDLLWEKIVPVIEKICWNLRLKAENLQNLWDH